MSKKTLADYLRDMLHELDEIAAFTLEGKAAFMTDAKTRKAVIRSYEVVGEICKRLPDDLRRANPQLDWRRLIGFRDFLAHHYEEVILGFVWDAVEDLPTLRAAVETMLDGLDEQVDDNDRG
ncbi:MAG: hypothetical protein BroJett021_52970 [Chloroflexota bacterium]|nr:MAG: hypothetical protein BroJett021_52970 [Chloroflexota bacterium]